MKVILMLIFDFYRDFDLVEICLFHVNHILLVVVMIFLYLFYYHHKENVHDVDLENVVVVVIFHKNDDDNEGVMEIYNANHTRKKKF